MYKELFFLDLSYFTTPLYYSIQEVCSKMRIPILLVSVPRSGDENNVHTYVHDVLDMVLTPQNCGFKIKLVDYLM